MVIVQCQANLLEIVLALQTIGSLANSLHSRQKKPDKNGHDAYDDQQFNESETTVNRAHCLPREWFGSFPQSGPRLEVTGDDPVAPILSASGRARATRQPAAERGKEDTLVSTSAASLRLIFPGRGAAGCHAGSPQPGW
jgi:hypothetical protein